MKTIIFVFAGRKENMSLQLPFIRRVLESNPETEYHIWDLAQNESDHQWLQTISGERITVYDEFYGGPIWVMQNDIYRFYADEWFSGHRFVKIDEDVVFLADNRFGDFLDAINPDAFVSARVTNNGAGTESLLLQQLSSIGLELRDAHLSVEYAMMCHQYMFDHWRELTSRPVQLVQTTDWLSINLIGFTWQMCCEIVNRLGGQHLNLFANLTNVPREIKPTGTLGDEGVVNTFPRLLLQGFAASHLYFGPQRNQMSDTDIAYLRKHYAEIGRQYRESV